MEGEMGGGAVVAANAQSGCGLWLDGRIDEDGRIWHFVGDIAVAGAAYGKTDCVMQKTESQGYSLIFRFTCSKMKHVFKYGRKHSD